MGDDLISRMTERARSRHAIRLPGTLPRKRPSNSGVTACGPACSIAGPPAMAGRAIRALTSGLSQHSLSYRGCCEVPRIRRLVPRYFTSTNATSEKSAWKRGRHHRPIVFVEKELVYEKEERTKKRKGNTTPKTKSLDTLGSTAAAEIHPSGRTGKLRVSSQALG